MSKVLSHRSTDGKKAISELFAQASPILVEVRFLLQGTSPDWHLCEEQEDLDAILERLGVNTDVYLHSVWDLTNRKSAMACTAKVKKACFHVFLNREVPRPCVSACFCKANHANRLRKNGETRTKRHGEYPRRDPVSKNPGGARSATPLGCRIESDSTVQLGPIFVNLLLSNINFHSSRHHIEQAAPFGGTMA